MPRTHGKPWYRQPYRPREGGGTHRRAWHRRRADIAHLRRLIESSPAAGYALRQQAVTLGWLRELERTLTYGPPRQVEVRARCL